MKARDIDILLGTPARLAITASLAGAGPLTFTQLRQETGLADGNLHVQTRRLIDAGYLEGGKTQSGNRTLTSFHLTETGRERYRAHIRMIMGPIAGSIAGSLDGMRWSSGLGDGGASGTGSRRPKDDSQVW